MSKWLLQFVIVVFAAVGCVGQSSAASPGYSSCRSNATPNANSDLKQSGFSERYPRYQLLPGDVFDVTFEFVPDFNQSVTVQPDGFVTLREIGDLHVAGLTVPDLTRTLCNAYGKILYSPSIAINLKDFDKPYFTASGQIGHPGKYVLRSQTTVTEGIAIAGGFNEKAKHSQVLLFRRVSSQWSEARLLDVKKMLASKNLKEDMFLQPGDMIFIPQNTMSKIDRFLPKSAVNTYVNPTQY
jgi:polysaccharide export outer membrane protein